MVYSEFTYEYEDWLDGESGASRKAWFDTTLGELEAPPVAHVSPQATIRDVVGAMNQHHVGCVLIMEGSQMLGIFTERDVLRRVIPENMNVDLVQVGEVMTPRPDALPAGALLASALRLMALGGFRHLPVLDAHGVPIKVVSMRNILQHVSEAFPKEILNAPLPRESGVSLVAEGG